MVKEEEVFKNFIFLAKSRKNEYAFFMKLSIGIVGLPNVGKSTLFAILTDQSVTIANYPFATIDPNVGVVPVPDTRLDMLAKISNSKKIVPAVVEFFDIAGLVKGANKGEGLGNQFLTHIREVDAICMVLRVFKKNEIIHVEGSVDALRDMEIVETELVLKDFETVEKRLEKVSRDAKTGANKEAKKEEEALREIYSLLDGNKPLFAEKGLSEETRNIAKSLDLLTIKPQIFLLNGVEEDVPQELKNKIEEAGAGYVIIDLDDVIEVPELSKKAYEILNLISFLTTGEDETRAWTIRRGIKAPQAAGVIHTDFENKFVKLEAVSYEKFVEAGSWIKARENGWLRIEGRDYVVQDGDVVVVKHG